MVDIINPFIVGTFTPPVIITANGVFDFDADLGVTTNAEGVTAWVDQLVNVGDLISEGTSLRAPELLVNGNPSSDGDAIDFDGVGNRLVVSGGFTWNDPATIYLVMKANAFGVNDSFIDGVSAATFLIFQTGTTPNMALFSGATAANNTDLALSTWGIICAVFDGASSSLRINNNTKTTGDPQAANPGGLNVGARNGAGDASDMTVARVLGYDTTAHSDAEQDQNIAALNDIYSVF